MMQNLPVVNSINSAEVIHLGERGKPPVVKEDFTLAIQEYCLKRSFEDALCREEIGRLEKFARVDAQRKSLLVNTSRYYRDNPRADVAPGVLTFITLLSDNDRGACTLSQAQMAIVLYRTRTTIAEAVTRLRASGLVRSVNGKAMSYPTIPRVVARDYNHVVWVVDALKNVATCPVDPTGRNLSRRADTCSIPVPSKRQVNVATCRVEGGQPVGSTGHNFTKEEFKKEERGIAAVAAAIAMGLSAAIPAAAAPHVLADRIQQTVAECWQTPKARMDAGLSIHEAKAQKQIWMTPFGVLEAVGDFKAELEREFPDVPIKLGLSAVAANVNPGNGALTAMKAIRRQFAYMQTDAEGKRKRAEMYVKANGKAAPPKDVKPEGMPDSLWARILEDRTKASRDG